MRPICWRDAAPRQDESVTMTDANQPAPEIHRKPRSPAAERALAEAAARRAEQEKREAELAAIPEEGGPKGPEPVRYGDWEIRGIASDF
jgi:hypothetical protein